MALAPGTPVIRPHASDLDRSIVGHGVEGIAHDTAGANLIHGASDDVDLHVFRVRSDNRAHATRSHDDACFRRNRSACVIAETTRISPSMNANGAARISEPLLLSRSSAKPHPQANASRAALTISKSKSRVSRPRRRPRGTAGSTGECRRRQCAPIHNSCHKS